MVTSRGYRAVGELYDKRGPIIVCRIPRTRSEHEFLAAAVPGSRSTNSDIEPCQKLANIDLAFALGRAGVLFWQHIGELVKMLPWY